MALAVLDSGVERGKARILARDERAAAAGVELGMTATQSQARCADLVLLERSDEGESALRERLLTCAEGFAPDLEDTAGGVATVDLVGDPELDVTTFGRRIGRAMAGVRACGGLGPTPDLALLAAKVAAARGEAAVAIGSRHGEAARFLAPLPVTALEPDKEMAEILRLWGIRTCGELASLPETAAAERLGTGGAVLRALAAGRGQRRLLQLVREPKTFVQSTDIAGGAETLEPVLFLVRRLLETLMARLRAAYLVAGELWLRLDFEDGNHHERVLRVPEPCAEVELLFRMVGTHLDGVSASAPVVVLGLEARPARASRHQRSLFANSLRDPNRFAETLARLEAMAGAGRVGMPVAALNYHPDSFLLKEFRESDGAAEERSLPAAIGPTLRRFRPPVAVTVLPVGGTLIPGTLDCAQVRGRIRLARGPWLISGHWWEPGTRWQREEWDVEMARNQGTYRLARVGEAWFLEGRYG